MMILHRLGLVLALLLTLLGLYLVIDSIVYLYINILNLAVICAIAFLAYIIIRAVGSSLNKRFDKSINAFLKGKSKELFDDKPLLRTFGFLLIVLLPFLIFLLLLSLYATANFVIYIILLLTYIRLLPWIVLIALGIVAIGTAFAILVGIFYLFFPPGNKTPGFFLSTKKERKLWKLTRDVAEEVKARPINMIKITPLSGIGVYQEGSLISTLMGKGKRVLELGIPALQDLKLEEFKAILAHEYGHFSNRDTQWSRFTYSMGSSLTSTLNATPGPAREGPVNIIHLVMYINPAYWMMLIYVKLYFKITNGFSRVREVMADIHAMEVYGGKTFSEGLMRVAMNSVIFNSLERMQIVPMFLKGKVSLNMSGLMSDAYTRAKKADFDKLKNELLKHGAKHDEYDSHPALKTRLDYSTKFKTGRAAGSKKATSIFENWKDINAQAADKYNARLKQLVENAALAAGAQQQDIKKTKSE
ncbi:M48 family metalloprotease [Thermoproteota archaeon]